jgi:Protein of unknown function (DUF3808)
LLLVLALDTRLNETNQSPAQLKLTEAENAAYEIHRRTRKSDPYGSKIYSAGTEYMLCQAQTQIMSAVLGVMSESISESIKAFYKLRKAYLTLEQIIAEEQKHVKMLDGQSVEHITLDTAPEELDASQANGSAEEPELRSSGEDFVDAVESLQAELTVMKTDSGLLPKTEETNGKAQPRPLQREPSQIQDGPDKEIFSTFLDSVIHSSSNMWFGLLLILISMTPPALNTLSKIIGFKGDRKRGIAMLWQATKFGNLNGAFAGLALLAFYNGFTSFCDVLPKAGSQAFPEHKCKELLVNYRRRYPKVGIPKNRQVANNGQSCLWLLEESRMKSINKGLEDSLKLLHGMPKSGLIQVTALQCFQVSMNSMFLHRYEICSESFQKVGRMLQYGRRLQSPDDQHQQLESRTVLLYRSMLPCREIQRAFG